MMNYIPDLLIFFNTYYYVLWSNALVLSSNISTFGFFNRARAIANLCFCPPLTDLNYEYRPISLTNLSAFTNFSTEYTSESDIFSAIKTSLIVFPISTGSCPTYPIFYLRQSFLTYFIFIF